VTRLYLVRHGETDANRDGLALGRANVPLNERGVWQAERLRETLEDEPFAAVYSSPLSRTRKIAEMIASEHSLDVTIEEALVEMDVGELDGLTFAEVRERHLGLLQRWSSADGPGERLPGGERLLDVSARATEFLNGVRDLHPAELVCAVTHNFVILTILADVLGIGIRSFRQLRHSLAAVSELEADGSRWRIVRMNDTSHLDDRR